MWGNGSWTCKYWLGLTCCTKYVEEVLQRHAWFPTWSSNSAFGSAGNVTIWFGLDFSGFDNI